MVSKPADSPRLGRALQIWTRANSDAGDDGAARDPQAGRARVPAKKTSKLPKSEGPDEYR